MDLNSQAPETQEDQNQNQLASLTPPFATLSLSLSTILPTHFLVQPKISSLLSPQPNKVKISSSLTDLSISSSLLPPKPLFKSTTGFSLLQNPLSINPRKPSEPSNAAGIRRSVIVWFRNDLRVHDNECLTSANNEAISVLPVYCFDPRDYGKSSSGFDKTGPYRATFLTESVADLRKNLQSKGSDLVVRIGKPESVLVDLVKAVGADAIYAHREVSNEEVKGEERIEAAMKEEGVEVKYFWGSTLYHEDDLPFKVEDMPTNYGEFKEKVKGVEIRKTIAALDQLRGLPSRGDVEPGEIPSLTALGLNPSATVSQGGTPAVNASMTGGETEALNRLQKFAAECQAQPPKGSKDGTNNSIYGANFSCKISPWLSMGCLSPRSMFEELNKYGSSSISAAFNGQDGGSGSSDGGTNWLMYELMWRDFFRFITKKYSSVNKLESAPATACTPAFA